MTSTKHFSLPVLACLVLTLLALAGCVVIVWRLAPWQPDPTRLRPPDASESTMVPVAPVALGQAPWQIFQDTGARLQKPGGPQSTRFRLAGTWIYTNGGEEKRKAVIDDLAKGRLGVIVSESEMIDAAQVVQIQRDRVVLRENGAEIVLELEFRGRGEVAAAAAGTNGQGQASATNQPPANRFGIQQIAQSRWNFDRQALMSYYKELMDAPERLVKVFDSLKPLYDDDNKITGYWLGVEGESEFFDAAGLQEGDVVRAVNSMPMTNRRRAEHFIEDFVKEDASVFVLDVERGNARQKLIYEVR
jgi:type II secretory pathway component PulC